MKSAVGFGIGILLLIIGIAMLTFGFIIESVGGSLALMFFGLLFAAGGMTLSYESYGTVHPSMESPNTTKKPSWTPPSSNPNGQGVRDTTVTSPFAQKRVLELPDMPALDDSPRFQNTSLVLQPEQPRVSTVDTSVLNTGFFDDDYQQPSQNERVSKITNPNLMDNE